MLQRLYLITTGGTIEKIYSEQSGQVQNVERKIDRYLQQLRLPYLDLDITPLLNKDSLEMTDADRDLITSVVHHKLSQPAPIVITHGTDTMVDTGLYLQQRIGQSLTVPIVLTGAMSPLGFERSDGLQNLTESLLAARLLPPGIYVVMHNQAFPIDRVRKDRELARFVWK